MSQSHQHRHPMDFAASVTVGAQTLSVRVMDLSEDGMRIATPHQATAGTPVYMATPNARVTGEVRWCRGNNIGVSFLPKLTTLQVESFCNGSAHSKSRRYSSNRLQELR